MENSVQTASASYRSNMFNLISIFPMITSISILFSVNDLLILMRTGDIDNIPLGFGQWHILYITALAALVAAFVNKTVPHAWQLMIGAIIIVGGALAVPLVSKSLMQIHLITITLGFGVTLMFHASYPSVSQYFKSQSIVMCSVILTLFWLVIVNAFQLMEEVNSVNQAMLLIGAGTALTCIMPAGIMIKLKSALLTPSQGPRHHFSTTGILEEKSNLLSSYKMPIAIMFPNVSLDVHHLIWKVAGLSIAQKTGFVFLAFWWALGVNFTSLNENRSFAIVRTAAVQCALPLVTVAVKAIALFRNRHVKSEKVDSKTAYDLYFSLGLIGISGMTLVVYPAFTNPFHNHLLFSVVNIIQVMDLADTLGSLKVSNYDVNEPNPQHGKTNKGYSCPIFFYSLMGLLIGACLLYFTSPLSESSSDECRYCSYDSLNESFEVLEPKDERKGRDKENTSLRTAELHNPNRIILQTILYQGRLWQICNYTSNCVAQHDAVLSFANSFDLAIATDVIYLGVFSLLTVILSLVRLSDA